MLQIFLLTILGIDWASGYAIAGYCMRHGVNAYGYAFWQSFGPMLILLLVHLVAYPPKIKISKAAVKYVVLSGLSGVVIPNLLIYLAASHVPSGLLTLISNISPLFVYALALLYQEEKFNVIRCSSIVAGLIGVVIIITAQRKWFRLQLGDTWGLITFLIPFGYAFCAVYVAKFRPAIGNSLNYALGMLLVATLFNTPLVYLNNGFYALHMGDVNSWLIILEILLSTAGYVLMFVIIQMVGAVYYTLVNTTAALTGLVYGYFIFKQSYPNSICIAISLLLLALLGLSVTQKNLRHQKLTQKL